MVSAEANTATKASASTSTRRRKIEIKKVEQQNRRHVTFSKRKLGLFNKVTELSILCQAEIALIVTSPNGKLYACGYPTPDTVIQRFLAGGNPVGGSGKRKQQQQQEEMVETLRLQYEAIQDQLKEEKKNLQAITEAQKSSSSFPSWWHRSIDDMGLECLEHFKTSLEHLKINLVTAVDEKRFNPLPPLPLQVVAPPPPPTMLSNYSLLSTTECFGGQQQARDWNGGSGSSSGSAGFMVHGFGHYWQHGSL